MLDTLLASHKVGRIFGIDVRFAYSLYIFTGFMVLLNIGYGFTFVLAIAFLWLFVFLHELGHSFAAIKDGVSVRSITLTPLGGVAQLEGMIPGPMSEIMIALAGPFVSLLCAALAVAPGVLSGGGFAPGGVVGGFLDYVFTINMYLALFNLLPIFPLDGGRVAAAASTMAWGPDEGLRKMGKIALVGVIFLAAWGFLRVLRGDGGGVILILIAFYLHSRGGQELQARQYASRYTYGYGGGYGGGYSASSAQSKSGWLDNWLEKRKLQKQDKERKKSEDMNREVDRILAKVHDEGINSLTDEERDVLNRASRSYRDE